MNLDAIFTLISCSHPGETITVFWVTGISDCGIHHTGILDKIQKQYRAAMVLYGTLLYRGRRPDVVYGRA
jgi:hypothetical protein